MSEQHKHRHQLRHMLRNHAGHQGNVEIEAMWNTRGYINFNTTASDGLLFIATKDVLYIYCGINKVCFFTNQQQMLQMIGLRKTK